MAIKIEINYKRSEVNVTDVVINNVTAPYFIAMEEKSHAVASAIKSKQMEIDFQIILQTITHRVKLNKSVLMISTKHFFQAFLVNSALNTLLIF